jgi:hypothetical protein
LAPRLLHCALGSANDVHHGAAGHPGIEKAVCLVDGLKKCCFDRSAVEALCVRGVRCGTFGSRRSIGMPNRRWQGEIVVEAAA